MSAVTSSLDELAGLIQPEKIAEEGLLRPLSVSITEGMDHSGEPAYYFCLVYPNKTSDAALAWKKVKPVIQWIRSEIRRAAGEERWPYFRILRKSDLPSVIS